MTNNIRSLVASGLVALAGVAGADTNDAVFTSIKMLPQSFTNRVELRVTIPAGNTNHYTVQFRDDLTSGVWADSVLNTNVYSRTGRKSEQYLAEPLVASNRFYRLSGK